MTVVMRVKLISYRESLSYSSLNIRRLMRDSKLTLAVPALVEVAQVVGEVIAKVIEARQGAPPKNK